MDDNPVLIEYLGDWLPATVVWRYAEMGRPRVLLRFETPAGVVVRQLRWADELRPSGRMLVLDLRVLRPEEAGDAGSATGPEQRVV